MGEMADMYGEWPDGPAGSWDPDDDPADEAPESTSYRKGVRRALGRDRFGDEWWVEDSEPLDCVNCDGPIDGSRRSYLSCSDLCDGEAAHVRYARKARRDGRDTLPEVRQVLETQLAHVLGGGYPNRRRVRSRKLREAVFARDGRRCRECRALGHLEIDHIDGNSNHPDNLQVLCHACHVAKTQLRVVPIPPDRPDVRAKRRALDLRVKSPMPLRPSDDDETWEGEWRQIVAGRKEMTA